MYFISFRGKIRDGGRRDIQRKSFHLLVTPQMASTSSNGLGLSQKAGTVSGHHPPSPTQDNKGPLLRPSFAVFSGTLAGRVIKNGTAGTRTSTLCDVGVTGSCLTTMTVYYSFSKIMFAYSLFKWQRQTHRWYHLPYTCSRARYLATARTELGTQFKSPTHVVRTQQPDPSKVLYFRLFSTKMLELGIRIRI